MWKEIETTEGAQAKVDLRLSASEKEQLKQQFYANKSGGTYYIDEDACGGSGCVYVAFAVSIADWRICDKESIVLDGGLIIANEATTLTGVILVPDGSDDASQAANIASVVMEQYGTQVAMAADKMVFIRSDIFVSTDYPSAALAPLTGSKPCVVAARELGSCAYVESSVKYSNVFYDGLMNQYPVVMGNCVACDSCINACPYNAIKNRYSCTAEGLAALDASGQFLHHYVKNSRAVLGSNL